MRITGRAKKIAFFVTLGACLVGLALALNVTWIVLNWREVVPLVLGIIFFALIIAGIVVYTVFLVREIHKNEQQDSFLNAVTHELKTPIASIRLYLETLQTRQLRGAAPGFLSNHARGYGPAFGDGRANFEGRRGAPSEQQKELGASRFLRDRGGDGGAHAAAASFAGRGPPVCRLCRRKIYLRGNPQELRTAVFNLVENAVKYSGEKKEIEVDLLTPDIDTILLRVRDKGVGIPHPELKRIFKRFYRVASSATGRVKGPGSACSSCARSRGGMAAMRSPKAKARGAEARSRCGSRGPIPYEPDSRCGG